MSESDPPVMTVAEVAAYLRIRRASVYKLAQKGKIPGQKVGRHWRFHRLTIERWLARPEVGDPPEGQMRGAADGH